MDWSNMKHPLAWLLSSLLLAASAGAQAPSPFTANARAVSAHEIRIELRIPAGHALYADKSRIQVPMGWHLQSQTPALIQDDPVAGRTYLWRGEAEATLVRNPGGSVPKGIEIQLQGCWETEQICFPAERKWVPLRS
jgi:hypothetical protein